MPHYFAENVTVIMPGDKFIISKANPKLPTDMNNVEVRINDILILHHNKRIIKVGFMEHCGKGVWIIGGCNDDGWTSHGCFLLPESKDNIEHATEADLERLYKIGFHK